MIVCKKCNVEVDTVGDFCPLCHTKIGENKNSTYPTIKTRATWRFIKKLLLFNVILVSTIAILLNRTLATNTSWSPFVIAGLITMYTVFLGVMKGRKRILSMLFYMSFLVIIMTIGWDKLIGFKGWSINYVLPSLAISYGVFLIVLRFVSHFAFVDNSVYIYMHVLLEFVPLILFYKGIITFKPLAVISAIFGLVNLTILLIFDFSHIKKDIVMRLHI